MLLNLDLSICCLEILCNRTGGTSFAHMFYLNEWLTTYGYSDLNKSKKSEQ